MMKLFKKLLAVAMVAVLALTVLTGCDAGTTDPDAVYPDDETENVVCALNNGAAAANQPQLTYSVKYSKITKELLDNYLDNYGNISKYNEEYKRITDALDKNVKIIVDVIPSTNPTKKSSFKYTELYKVTDYHLAEKVGVAFKDSSSGTRYLLICTFDVEE